MQLSNGCCAAIIVAAGRGKRMGADKNKVLLPLAGKPIIWWTLQGFVNHPDHFQPILLVTGREDMAYMQGMVEGNGWAERIRVVEGGEERMDSVQQGLRALGEKECEWVAVHDGARPLFTPALLTRCIQKVTACRSAVVAVPVKDTIKKVSAGGKVIETPERSGMYAVQTPQVFAVEDLIHAYDRLNESRSRGYRGIPTDDAMVMEMAGYPVYLVEGEYENVKLTTPEDLVLAEAILKRRREQSDAAAGEAAAAQERATELSSDPLQWLLRVRTGMGYDVHKLVEGRKLILGGVDVPYEKGLLGHSDADVLLHAIKDAMLGAASMGDIGRHFPDNDPTYKGISSILLLEAVDSKLKEQGWTVVNIDATIVAQRPKLAPFIPAMQQKISQALGIPVDRINVKATTTEGLGFTGTGEGIAAYAVATVVKN
ncbi:2-C-methyl-D-erythritol 4-phosphate cytidylyltransferase [Heliobacterium chlorum]|uniref:Bifunctional enzyme IspD/IspF n=1 Tax=Heliobacterium chlorum TaxID=2698 RepID=A0ABR7T5W1_HELCL|nr:2-C-methyl-D-erythritol 4-phosphate cytidylyltransferase [Heliobacterium chlorum]